MMCADLSRVYFYAKAVRPVYVNLPDEDRTGGDEQMCGRLVMSMYGTRDAAMGSRVRRDITPRRLRDRSGEHMLVP